jgi:RHS repeat-associated protein
MIASVEVPGTAQKAFFQNLSDFTVVPIDVNGVRTVSCTGTRAVAITDLEGLQTTYTFTGHEAHLLDMATYAASAGNARESRPMFPPVIVYHKVMEVQRGTFGKETYEFDPEAGMALKKEVDLGGKVTEYTYCETRPVSHSASFTAAATGLCTHAGGKPLFDGQRVRVGSETMLPGGLVAGKDYFVIDLETNEPEDPEGSEVHTFKLSETRNGPPVQITGPGGNSTHTIYILNGIGEICPSMFGWAKYFDDPTFVTDAAGTSEFYVYNGFRERLGAIDKTSLITAGDNWLGPPTEQRSWRTELSPATLRALATKGKLLELIHPLPEEGQPLRQTLYQYDSTFRGVVTRQTEKALQNDPPWAGDVTTVRDLDANGNVAKESVGGKLVAEMTYDLNGNCTSILRGGWLTTHTYDAHNRPLRTYFPSPVGENLHYRANVYDANGNKVQERDENGNITYSVYDERNRLSSQYHSGSVPGLTVHKYNLLGSEVETIDPRGTVTMRGFDKLQRLLSVTEAVGRPESRQIIYRYPAAVGGTDANAGVHPGDGFQPTSVIDSRGFITRTTYDELHRVSENAVAYNTPGQDPAGQGPGVARTTTLYDDAGRVRAVIDPRTNETQTDYDAFSRPEIITYADGKTIQNFYTSAGLKWKVKNENDKYSEWQYDALGRVTTELGPEVATGQRPQTSYVYDAAGNVASKHVLVSALPAPKFSTWTYQYDGRNRKIREISPVVETGNQITQWSYDAVGNVVAISDAREKTTTKYYNSRNWLLRTESSPVKNVEGQTVRAVTESVYDENGNVVTAIDAEGRQTTNTYDRLNRLKTTKDHAGILVSYGYDDANNRTSVTDGKNQITTFTYDGLNRVLVDQPPNGPPRVNIYDACNRVMADSGNGFDQYFYDARNRLEISLSKGIGIRTYGYHPTGQLAWVDDAETLGSVTYNYDSAGRLTSETSAGVTHTYEYDLAGNRIRTHYGASEGGIRRTIESEYDAVGRLKEMHEKAELDSVGSERTTLYFYDGNGNIIKKALPNGDTEQTSYDALNRRRLQAIKRGNIPLLSHEQFYDRTGNVRVIIERVEGESAKDRRLLLGYDGANRLVSEKSLKASGSAWLDDGAVHYEYDNANNRTWKRRYAAGVTVPPPGGAETASETWQSTYNLLNQLIRYEHRVSGLSQSVAEYVYDGAGNRTERTRGEETISYYYNLDDRLDFVERWTGYMSESVSRLWFTYDHRSRLIQRAKWQVGDYDWSRTRISFSGGTSVSEFGDSANPHRPTAEFIRGSDWGGGVGGLLYSLRPGLGIDEPRYTHYNGRGDVVLQTDQMGAKPYEAAYEAFGTRVRENGSSQDRQRANTKEEEAEFGLLNEGQRYRDLETGVWLTRDPAGFVDGPNLYAYVRQNPWSKFDPHGLTGWQLHHPGAPPHLQNTNPEVNEGFKRGAGAAALAVGVFGWHLVPGVGEMADLAEAEAAEAGSGEQARANASAQMGILTFGAMPNRSGVRAAMRVVADSMEADCIRGTSRASQLTNQAAELKPLQAGESTTYKDFAQRSKTGDGLAGHELWQHANLNEHGLTTSRLSTPASQANPVIVLGPEMHKEVNAAQRGLDARKMTPPENIRANAQILRALNAADGKVIDKAEKAALEHARDYGY